MLTAFIIHFFLLLNNIPLYRYSTFIHSSVEEYLGCSYFLAVVNSSLNMGVHGIYCVPEFKFFRSGIAWSYS